MATEERGEGTVIVVRPVPPIWRRTAEIKSLARGGRSALTSDHVAFVVQVDQVRVDTGQVELDTPDPR